MVRVIEIMFARSLDGVFGAKPLGGPGYLPWPRLSMDMARFRDLTYGRTVLMGRGTYESLPRAGRPEGPLPGRTVVVASRTSQGLEGVYWCGNPAGFLSRHAAAEEEVMVVGGPELICLAFPFARRVHQTVIEIEAFGLVPASDRIVQAPIIPKYFEQLDAFPVVDGRTATHLQFNVWRRLQDA